MDLLLSEEQRLLQDSAARMLAQAGGLKRTRELRAKSGGFDRTVLARMGQEGWLGLMVPEEEGGMGLGLTELALVLMEAGRVLAPEPIAALAAVSAVMAGAPATSEIAAGVIEGRTIVMPAIAMDGTTPKASTSDAGRSWRLDGICDGVPMAAESDGFLVAADGGGGAPLIYVPRGSPGLHIEPRPTVDGRSLARLSFEAVTAGQIVAPPETGSDARRRLLDLLLFAQAAELVGLMSAAIDITVEYLKTRRQFGKPIGSFQALQHRAVDDFAQMVSARSFLFQVAAQDGGLASSMASALKAYAATEALEVTKSAIQMHGGIGFTEECDIGLFLKRTMWLSAWLGNSARHRERYAELMG